MLYQALVILILHVLHISGLDWLIKSSGDIQISLWNDLTSSHLADNSTISYLHSVKLTGNKYLVLVVTILILYIICNCLYATQTDTQMHV